MWLLRWGYHIGVVWALIRCNWCLYKSEIWVQTGTWGKHHVKMKADIGVMFLQAKECQRLPVWLSEARGESMEQILTAPRGNQPCRFLDLGLWPSELEIINSSCYNINWSQLAHNPLLWHLQQTNADPGQLSLPQGISPAHYVTWGWWDLVSEK